MKVFLLSRWRIFKCLLLSIISTVFIIFTINHCLVNQNTTKNTSRRVWCLKLKYLEPNLSHELHNEDSSSNPVALASFPGSGNTWLRYLLQQATGVLTGSVYNDYDLLTTSFPGEGVRNSSVLVVKTHEWGPDAWTKFRRAILLVRDPHRAILAEFNRQHSGHLGLAPRYLFRRKLWEKFVYEKLSSWTEMNLAWVRNYPHSIQVVFFDDLVSDLRGSLQRILQFLKWPINEEAISCAIERQRGVFKRRKITYDPYNKIMKDKLDSARNYVFREIKRIQED